MPPLPLLRALLACSPEPPALDLPIACDVGVDCWITSLPDTDPAPGAFRDYEGGSRARDAHSGTDVSVRHVGQAVATWGLAPAGGTVLRARSDIPDGEQLAGWEAEVEDHECGNGVVLDAGGGWELQLCHFLAGSVVVSPGDVVAAGDHLGRIGWSGEADHPHVHLTVRRDGRDVDPFSGRWMDDGAAAAPGPLWAAPLPSAAEMDALAWAGFVAGPKAPDGVWNIDGPRGVVPASAPSLVLEVFVWRPREGDVVRTEITRPDGTVTRAEAVQSRDRIREIWRVEKTWPDGERPVGLWTARVEWERGGRKREIRASAVLE